jgi:hypothetical protein
MISGRFYQCPFFYSVTGNNVLTAVVLALAVLALAVLAIVVLPKIVLTAGILITKSERDWRVNLHAANSLFGLHPDDWATLIPNIQTL